MKFFLNPPNTYLFVAEIAEDAEKLYNYSVQEPKEYTRIGDKTFFGFFRDRHDTIYEQLKEKLGISGKIYWVQLPPPDET